MTAKETMEGVFGEIAVGLVRGRIVPYLGPGVYAEGGGVPASPWQLADWLCGQVSIPARLRGNLTAVAQYIENFKHRRTLTRLMTEVFMPEVSPGSVHRLLATLPDLPLVVDTWYDGTTARSLLGGGAIGRPVCQLTGVSRAEHPEAWFRRTGAVDSAEAAGVVLYKPHGCVYPEPSFLVSDSDYVEVLTEIDIQTPIPPVVQRRRTGCHFLLLGCRFNQQLDRIFARQIMKRSSDRHWAVLHEEPTKKEAQFLAVQQIVPIKMNLDKFLEILTSHVAAISRAGQEELSCRSA